MKLTKNQWRERKIVNSYDVIKLCNPKVFISYRPQVNGRASQCAAWQVVHIGYQSDPNSHWRDCGHKTFALFCVKAEKEPKLKDAMEFAKAKYGVAEWERGLSGDWYPKGSLQMAFDKTSVTVT